jgi:hypothetical protein
MREPPLATRSCSPNKLLKGESKVGHEGAVCRTVSLQRQEAQCVATYWFRGGQITGQALVTLGSAAPYAVAITGGSGNYEGAEGEHPPSVRNRGEIDLPCGGLTEQSAARGPELTPSGPFYCGRVDPPKGSYSSGGRAPSHGGSRSNSQLG